MKRIVSTTALALLFLGLAASAPAAFAQSATGSGAALWVTTTQRIKSKIYENARLSQHPVLVVVIHADSPDGSPSTYQYRFAALAAAALPDTVVAAVLRPGYRDGEDSSDGQPGYDAGDNWTPEIVDAVAAVLAELKDRYHPRSAILVGHSGGASIAGSLLGRHATAVDGALLVACPCDVAAWRKHMHTTKGGGIWERPVRSLSPLALVDRVSTSAKVSLLVGEDDQTTPSALTLAYAQALQARNVAVNVTIAPGLGHRILLEPIAMDRLKGIVSAIDPGRE